MEVRSTRESWPVRGLVSARRRHELVRPSPQHRGRMAPDRGRRYVPLHGYCEKRHAHAGREVVEAPPLDQARILEG